MEGIQLSLPLMPKNINEIYVDQAQVNEFLFASYTPWGIRCIDSAICRKIQNLFEDPKKARKMIQDDKDLYEFQREELLSYVDMSPNDLREAIICNPHLHACIKQNLLENLDSALNSSSFLRN